ncbi:MAG: hypothetical protein A2374_05260 [Candidatus Moranbacteria bacterium RIFOXYB1_FULL_44_23]|nr:MAG: hypothetical protein A2407_05255 [Candidatus Moranbacteria bacterium RIFOXYC1_FULL_44_8]OGI40169.1 MAG: hypothetical protein A2374_05260 [Candidatus Moranbacteria bacterium RIFOXYB1_FULL_44_23]HBB37265.1 hypothetical protein [Candidatus Moranbacteria bacterium]HBU25197.1 hypothetical protein [Candidatus Moranbacteria bacterium]
MRQATHFENFMLEYSDPNFRISHPKRYPPKDVTKENPLEESTAVLDDIKKLGAQLRETKINLNGLLEKQKEFCVRFGEDMSEEEFARLASAINEIRGNISCLRQMHKDIIIAMETVLYVDQIYKENLDNFEGKTEN